MQANLETGAGIAGFLPIDGGRNGWSRAPNGPESNLARLNAVLEHGLTVSDTEATLLAMGQVVEQRDKHTAGHCERLAFLSVAIGQAVGLSRPDLLALYRGGYLHDIGKVAIPDSILFKPGKLNAMEWVVMRTHPARGAEICRTLKSLEPVLPLIRHHHERWDGNGYPDGLRGEQIPLLARIVQVVDIYDALTNPRPYKKASSPARALRTIQLEAQRGWRDPEITRVFSRLHGSIVVRAREFLSGTDRHLEAMRIALTRLR